jgi:hypothetical protein
MNNDTKVEHCAFRCRCKFSSVDDAWLLSLDISVKKAKNRTLVYRNTITIGYLKQVDLYLT